MFSVIKLGQPSFELGHIVVELQATKKKLGVFPNSISFYMIKKRWKYSMNFSGKKFLRFSLIREKFTRRRNIPNFYCIFAITFVSNWCDTLVLGNSLQKKRDQTPSSVFFLQVYHRSYFSKKKHTFFYLNI